MDEHRCPTASTTAAVVTSNSPPPPNSWGMKRPVEAVLDQQFDILPRVSLVPVQLLHEWRKMLVGDGGGDRLPILGNFPGELDSREPWYFLLSDFRVDRMADYGVAIAVWTTQRWTSSSMTRFE